MTTSWARDDARAAEVQATVAAIQQQAITNVAAEHGTDPDLIAEWQATRAAPKHFPWCSYVTTHGWAFCDGSCP